ncbi:B12-binding domain-containing radical SAM protein [Thermoplasmatota archaeon]
MNILIIENINLKKYKYSLLEKTLLTSFSILPTIYPRRLAAITPKEHMVHVFNDRYEELKINKKYDLINIHFNTASTKKAYEIADKFREKKVKVILSGLHASALPDESLKHADSILFGRGELNWLTLLTDFKNNKLKKFYPPEDYKKTKITIPPTNIKLPGFQITGAIEATRGCPYQCTFCPETNTPNGNKYYSRPIKEVINEIKKIPQKTIIFYDNSLTIKPDYTKQLFKEMKKLRKKFFCNGNVDTLANDIELVELSKQAGCIAWLIGFESVSQETIKQAGKKTNKIEIYEKAVKNIHKNKMAVIGDFMFGFDNDTKEVFDITIEAIKKMKIDIADFSILTPFPGTPVFNALKKEKRIIENDWSKYNMYDVVFQPKNMNPDELRSGVKKMYNTFYSNNNTIKRIFRSFKLGFYPFFLVVFRNMLTNIGSKKFKKNQ